MIDAQGYRANVAIVILNNQGKVFWGKRIGQTSWQFPQGGVNESESILAAMYRELYEEVGLRPQDVEILAVTSGWLRYNLPKHMIRRRAPICVGQKQKWFLLRLVAPESHFNLNAGLKAEFDDWRWVAYWSPVKKVVYFKQKVYQKALRYFVPFHRQVVDKYRITHPFASSRCEGDMEDHKKNAYKSSKKTRRGGFLSRLRRRFKT